MAVSLRYHITVNVDVEDGITNGADCVLKKIQYSQENRKVPKILWVQFDDNRIGHHTRRKFVGEYSSDIDQNWTPIFALDRTYEYNRHTVVRTQFPLTPAAAKTIHKAQGLTYNEIVVKMGENREEHMHYVALSRVKNLAGLQILKLNEDKISVSPLVEEELERLRQDAPLRLCFTPISKLPESSFKIVYHNTRSLHKHFPDLKSNHLIKGAHIIGIAETKLYKADSSDQYAMPKHPITRNDQKQHSPQRPPHGLLVYCHENIEVKLEKLFTKDRFEYVLQHVNFNGKSIQIVTVYISPNCDTRSLKAFLQDIRKNIDCCEPFVLIGDTNLDFFNKYNRNKIDLIENMLQCKQLMSQATTNNQTVIDHIYSNVEKVDTGVIDSYWSDHKFIYAAVPLEL